MKAKHETPPEAKRDARDDREGPHAYTKELLRAQRSEEDYGRGAVPAYLLDTAWALRLGWARYARDGESRA